MDGTPRIEIPYDAIAEFCRRHHIRRLSLFGSVLRDDFTDESDVDVLVEFEEGHVPGWNIVDMEDELAAMLGRPIDFVTVRGISKYYRDRVLQERRVIYDAA